MRQGIEPPDIAVLLRGDAGTTALFAQVLAGYGIPVSHDRRVPLARTRLGAGVLAGARAALPGGAAEDLLTWLRTPGRLADPAPRGRARGARAPRRAPQRPRRPLASGSRASAARRSWRSTRSPRRPRDGRRGAAARARGGGRRDLDRAAPAPRRVLASEELADARVASDLRAAVGELRGLAAADADLLGGPHDILEALGAVQVREPSARARPGADASGSAAGRRRARPGGRGRSRSGGRPSRSPARGSSSSRPGAPSPAGVLLADPLAIRARRFRAVFVCGLQDGEFPRRPVPEPFLSDEDRRGLGGRRAAAAAARGRPRPRALAVLRGRLAARGRALPLVALVGRGGRAARALGVPGRRPRAVHRRAVGRARHAAARRRHVGAARRAHAARAAPRLRRRRASLEPAPLGAPAKPRCSALLAARETEPARGLEAFAGCGVRWLVDQLLRPGTDRARPRADAARLARARGARAHARAAARAHRLRADRAGAARQRARGAARSAAPARGAASRGRPRTPARAAARAGGRPRALPAHGGRVRGRLRADASWNGRFGGPDDPHGPLALGGDGGL